MYLMEGKIVVVIVYCLLIIMVMDCLIVLDKGEIIE